MINEETEEINCGSEQKIHVLDWSTYATLFAERNELGNFIPGKKNLITI